jgi:hypothetical protein
MALAYEHPTLVLSRPVTADLSGSQYKVIKADGTISTTVGAGGVGILQNKPKPGGEPAKIMVLGVSPAVTGANVTTVPLSEGDFVTNDSDGGVRKAATGNAIIGVVAPGQSANAAGILISIIVLAAGAKA